MRSTLQNVAAAASVLFGLLAIVNSPFPVLGFTAGAIGLRLVGLMVKRTKGWIPKTAIAGIVLSLIGAVEAVNLSIHAGLAYQARQRLLIEADQIKVLYGGVPRRADLMKMQPQRQYCPKSSHDKNDVED